MNILQISARLRDHSISPVELTKQCLARIEKFDRKLNAFILVTAESALAEAKKAEEEILRGDWRGPLHGIPIALKDIIDIAGVPTTAGSNLFRNRVASEDADVVRHLKDAGAVFLGKQNLHEFAYGGSSMVSAYGPVRNPWNPEHIAGGSSGGSAASVAAEFCYAAIGTDTAGSIREPASLCGVVGFKPTFGLVSTRGIFPLSQSYDYAGPIARTVADATVMLQAIIGEGTKEDYVAALDQPLPKLLRLAIPRPFFFDDLDPEVSSSVEEALKVLRAFGELQEVELPVPTDRTLQSAESYAVHAEFISKNPELYQPETLRRIQNGANISSEQIARGRRELEHQREAFAAFFTSVDFLITPTVPIPAPLVSKLQNDPEQLRPTELILLRNTRPFNVGGGPAISIPCGLTQSGRPIGLQIAGPHHAEAAVLQLAHAYEQRTEWHNRKPPIV
jgi:aspartyl-tRNA(Asn)/glutamyl-tRNA(Gln) amidotransferase subunit A